MLDSSLAINCSLFAGSITLAYLCINSGLDLFRSTSKLLIALSKSATHHVFNLIFSTISHLLNEPTASAYFCHNAYFLFNMSFLSKSYGFVRLSFCVSVE
ncbi:hypothetical protein HOF65_04455 [bacterium]|nr:hypothetical protein [bacterium]